MTEKLFYQDSHQKEFEGTVLECMKKKEGYDIVLDRTVFFPEGGGQTADTGVLRIVPEGREVAVEDVQEEGGIIYHRTSEAIPVGRKVVGKIDYEERFLKMQQHSGEHIISGLVNTLFGYHNVGFHLGSEAVTMDFDGKITPEQLLLIENLANRAVAENLPVEVLYPSEEELASLTYRSKIEIEGQVRLVRIPGYDLCACCAPHVSATGEIGIIRLVNLMNHREGVRLTLLCGYRALEDYRRKEENVTRISQILSAKTYEVADGVMRLKEEAGELKNRLQSTQHLMVTREIWAALSREENCVVFYPHMDMNILRRALDDARSKTRGICAGFVGDEETGYHYILASSGINLREYGKKLNERFHGKGGGKPEMIQGSLKGEEEAIRRYISAASVLEHRGSCCTPSAPGRL